MNLNVGKEEEKTVDRTPVTPVAVIGMRWRLPGGIDFPQLLWDALPTGADLITEVPPDRWDADEYCNLEEPGVFLDTVADFGPESLGITFCGVSSAVRTSKALLGKHSGPTSGSMEAPLITIRGSRIISGYLTNRALLRDLEGTWSE
jgi:hypothetical protein